MLCSCAFKEPTIAVHGAAIQSARDLIAVNIHTPAIASAVPALPGLVVALLIALWLKEAWPDLPSLQLTLSLQHGSYRGKERHSFFITSQHCDKPKFKPKILFSF